MTRYPKFGASARGGDTGHQRRPWTVTPSGQKSKNLKNRLTPAERRERWGELESLLQGVLDEDERAMCRAECYDALRRSNYRLRLRIEKALLRARARRS